jgi:hypothetical protein
MTKIDWLAAAQKGMGAAKNEEQIKNVGNRGNSGNTINRMPEINILQDGQCVPTEFSVVGTMGTQVNDADLIVPTVPTGLLAEGTKEGDGNLLKKQIVSAAVPTVPTVPTVFNGTLKISPAPPDAVHAAIKRHKSEIVAWLRQETKPYDILADQVRFDRELAALRSANAKTYANPTPWKVKPR